MKNKSELNIYGLIIRYILILAIALFFYLSTLPSDLLLRLTIYPLKLIISLFTNVSLVGFNLVIGPKVITIISACVATSAYLLLLILNMLTPLRTIQRIMSLAFTLILLWLFNILRILFLTYLFVSDSPNFDIIHKVIWYFLSTIFVLILWFISCYLFKIKSIPVYSDILALLSQNKNKFKQRK